MQSYENLIYEKLQGDTPKEKYDFLEKALNLLQVITYPRRGTKESELTIQNVADMGQKFIVLDKN